MPSLRLTEISVRAIKSAGKQITYFDTITPNFGVRIGKAARTFIALKGRSRERITIGRWPDMTVGDARTEAKKLLANDSGEKTPRRTFLEAREEFIEEHYASKSAGTKYQVSRALKKHCTPLDRMQLADIGDTDIKRTLDNLADRPSERLHLFRYLRTFFRWCTRPPRRYLRHSPMEGYEAPGQDRRKNRILSDEEIKAVWNAATSPSEAAVRLMLLWGTRRGETCLLERSWASSGVFTIPGWQDDVRITKNGRSHAIPICPLGEHVLGTSTSNQYQFPGRWGGHITPRGLSEVVAQVQKRSGTSGWTLHDLRRTFRSIAARVGVSRDIAELLMNHAPRVLDDIYDRHSYVEEKRAALLRIEHFLVWLLSSRD